VTGFLPVRFASPTGYGEEMVTGYLCQFGNSLNFSGMMSALEISALAGSAAAAGAVNALAGGGTLLTFPTLLAFGTPPLVANATSTLALVLGTSGGIFGNRQHLKAITPIGVGS